MKTLILIILLLVGLPGLTKFDDPECRRLQYLSQVTQDPNIALGYLGDSLEVCYRGIPYIPGEERGWDNLQRVAQQGQINNLQRQQNLNTYLWLQQVNK